MPAGLQVFNDGGVYQIDGTTPNYVRTQLIGVSTSPGAVDMGRANSGVMNTNTANIANVSVVAQSPLFVLYSPNAPAAILKSVNAGGNSWTVQIWTLSLATNLELHVFEPSAALVTPGVGYGLQVFDTSGNLIADARQRFARILDVQQGNIFNVGAGWGEFTTVSSQSQSYGYSVAKVGVGAMATPWLSSPNLYYRTQGYQTNGGTVSRQWQYTRIAGTEPGTQNCFGSQLDWRFMAVDLSYM